MEYQESSPLESDDISAINGPEDSSHYYYSKYSYLNLNKRL